MDLLDLSTAGNDRRQKIKPGHQYQDPFAAAVKKEVEGSNPLVGAVGALYSGISAQDVLDVLETNQADVIFVGQHPEESWSGVGDG